MNPVAKELWLAALRSGEYKQGRGVLAQGSEGSATHCCLGVLCEVAIKSGVYVPAIWYWGVKYYGAAEKHLGLPAEVVEWSGLNHSGWLPESEVQLSYLNDEQHMSFSEIAYFIEEEL